MRPRLPFLAVLAVALALANATTAAQPAPPSAAAPITDDMPLPDYLGLLTQISPAAHEGARAYLLAFQQRCGRAMQTAELRRAMSDGEGDPVLMGMIRASHLKDTAALSQFGQRVACVRRSPR